MVEITKAVSGLMSLSDDDDIAFPLQMRIKKLADEIRADEIKNRKTKKSYNSFRKQADWFISEGQIDVVRAKRDEMIEFLYDALNPLKISMETDVVIIVLKAYNDALNETKQGDEEDEK